MGSGFYVIGRVQPDSSIFSSLTPALLILIFQFLENVACKNPVQIFVPRYEKIRLPVLKLSSSFSAPS